MGYQDTIRLIVLHANDAESKTLLREAAITVRMLNLPEAQPLNDAGYELAKGKPGSISHVIDWLHSVRFEGEVKLPAQPDDDAELEEFAHYAQKADRALRRLTKQKADRGLVAQIYATLNGVKTVLPSGIASVEEFGLPGEVEAVHPEPEAAPEFTLEVETELDLESEAEFDIESETEET
jgi:hypothetical protein